MAQSVLCRSVSNNPLSWSLPKSISTLQKLAILDASSTGLSGPISVLPDSLVVLVLHNNSLSGTPGQLMNLTSLCVATIFNNELAGSITLPQMKPECSFKEKPMETFNIRVRHSRLPLLLAQGNRLSCQARGNVSQFTSSDLLLAPGNQLSQPSDESGFKSLMADAHFIWVREVVDSGHWLFWYIIFGSVGLLLLAALLATVAWRGRGDAKECEHDFEKAMVACSKLLVPICVIVLPLGCWFWSARQSLYDCGDPVLKLTLAYFSDHKQGSYTLGRAASAAAFFYSIATLCVVHSFRMQMAVIYPRQQYDSHPQSINAVDTDSRLRLTIRQAASFMLYCLVIAGCSAVPILNIMAEYVPGYQSATDAMKPVTSLVTYIKPVAGLMLHIISSFVIPRLARTLSGSSRASVQWMVYSRLFINQLVTVGFTIWLSQDCFGGWLQMFFQPCDDPESFQVDARVEYTDGYSDTLSMALIFTRHEQVCGVDVGRPGRCLQAIVANLSKLLISKLVITAFVAPCTYLLFWCREPSSGSNRLCGSVAV